MCAVCSVVHNSLWPLGVQPGCPGIVPATILELGSHSFLQGIFLMQGSNPGFLYCRQILYHLSHWRSLNLRMVNLRMACCNSWGRKELDMTERLNWTEPIHSIGNSLEEGLPVTLRHLLGIPMTHSSESEDTSLTEKESCFLTNVVF